MSRYPSDFIVDLLLPSNPVRVGSPAYEQYAKLKDGITVGEAMARGIPADHLATWFEDRNPPWIRLRAPKRHERAI